MHADTATERETTPFAGCAREAVRLHDGLRELDRECGLLQLPALAGREWYELLTRKLLPQLAGEPFIVAAVVGGTNIGKSVIFNHLAGCKASAVSPLASGTKHPVCLVPPGFEARHNLAAIFPGFRLLPWSDAAAALENTPEHRLFWKTDESLPGNLLILDTPDIDSDAKINWERADCIRHCADVLIAVLTQQKYNDAAVKQFFRNAAAEDKAVIAVFNQCDLPEDEAWWPRWLETFSRETGIEPELLYVAPADRKAAEENRLPFFERAWSNEPGSEIGGTRVSCNSTSPRNLADDLSRMHFDQIKLRTLRGSLAHVLSPEIGVPAYLQEIRNRSAAFQDAARLLSMQQLARVDNWPPPPAGLLVDEIRRWWRSQRQGFTRKIHDVYGVVGNVLTSPFRWARNRIAGEPPDPRSAYRRSEYDVMLQTVDQLYGELLRLCQLGNDLLRPRLEELLAGSTRTAVLDRLTQTHDAVNIEAELHAVVASQMEAFRAESPGAFGWLKKLDSAAAVARPVTSVVLFVAAAGPVGHAIVPAAAEAAGQSLVVHIMGDIAGGTGAVVVGETALSGTAGGLRLMEARFRQLQAAFTARRVAWFAEFLRENILGNLQTELQAAATMTESEPFRSVRSSLDRLATRVPLPDAEKTS